MDPALKGQQQYALFEKAILDLEAHVMKGLILRDFVDVQVKIGLRKNFNSIETLVYLEKKYIHIILCVFCFFDKI